MKRHNLINCYMKNWISLLLTLALICGTAAGCGTSEGAATKAKADESRASETAGSEETAEEKTEMLSQTAEQAKNAADEAAQMQAQAQQVSDLIDGIGEITPGSGAELDEARIAYDALPENVRAMVSNYSRLEDAEASYLEATSAVAAWVRSRWTAVTPWTLPGTFTMRFRRTAGNMLTTSQTWKLRRTPTRPVWRSRDSRTFRR